MSLFTAEKKEAKAKGKRVKDKVENRLVCKPVFLDYVCQGRGFVRQGIENQERKSEREEKKEKEGGREGEGQKEKTGTRTQGGSSSKSDFMLS